MKNWRTYIQAGAWSFLALLLVPALWYSLRTPFGLIDDYSLWVIVKPFSHLSGIVQWFHDTWFDPKGIFRITNDLYQLMTWTLFGGNSTLHHAMRWVLKAVVIWSVYNTLRLMAPSKQSAVGLSFGVFCTIYVFFPNNAEAKLGTAEPLTVFFLGLLINELCRLCMHACGDLTKISQKRYLWLFFVFTGVLWSKEPNIVIGAVTLGFLACLNPRQWMRLFPFALVLLVTGIRVWAKKMVGGYGVAPITGSLVHINFVWYTKSLFLSDTGVICTLLLAVPMLFGVVRLLANTWRSYSTIKDRPVLLFSWMVFSIMMAFYAIVLTSWLTVPRYYYPLVYLLTLWIAMTLLALEDLSRRWRAIVSGLLIVMSVYFIGANYYNFVYQFACQHYTRAVEQDLLRSVDGLLKDGRTVTVTLESEYEINIGSYFNDYLPYYHHTDYRVTVLPAKVPLAGSYFVTRSKEVLPAGHQWYRCFDRSHVSRLLSWCWRISKYFQFHHPLFWPDPFIGPHAEKTQVWYIYDCRDIAVCR